jgi:hypothetical protein
VDGESGITWSFIICTLHQIVLRQLRQWGCGGDGWGTWVRGEMHTEFRFIYISDVLQRDPEIYQ